MFYGSLPDGVTSQRVTPDFTAETVPAGLLAAHHVAPGVWGVITCVAGDVTFLWEPSGDGVILHAGDSLVIPPDELHHVELQPGSVFHVEFFR